MSGIYTPLAHASYEGGRVGTKNIRARRLQFPGRPATICPGAGKLEERGEDNERTGLPSPFVVLWPKGCGPANAQRGRYLTFLVGFAYTHTWTRWTFLVGLVHLQTRYF